MLKNQIIEIFLKSKKPFNSLKPFQKELEEFINILYPKEKFSLLEIAYLYLNQKENIYCSICGKKKEFLNIEKGYNNFCSVECESKRIDNLILKEEFFNFLNSLKNLSNQKQISILKEKGYLSNLFYYTSFLLKEATFSERIYCILNNIDSTVLCKHCNVNKVNFKNNSSGYFEYCSNSCSFKDTKEKRKNTNIEKYGVENTFNMDKSNNNRNIIMANEEFKKKCIKSKELKYGKNKENIYLKVKNTWNNKTEEELKNIEELRKQKKIEIYGEDYAIKLSEKSSFSKKQNTIVRKIKLFRTIGIEPLFDLKLYKGVEDVKYKWRCLKCQLEYDKSIDNGLIPLCPKCNSNKGISKSEIEVINFIKELKQEYIQSDRTIIKPLEIDILIDNLGIEYNGLYYHSYEYLNEIKKNSEFIKNSLKAFKLNSNIGKSYHLLKSMLCEEKGINLIHINEDEWLNPIKKNIWKSIIKNKLNLNEYRIYARDCYIKEINVEDKDLFLEENHLQGKDNSSIRYGLYLKKKVGLVNKDELLSVMTFGASRYGNNEDFEMYRFCNKIKFSVIGSASKLFKNFLREQKPNTVLSYGDKRLGMNNFYEKIGFKKVGETIPGFRYIKNNKTFNRELFQKHLLKDYFINEKYGIKIFSEEFTGEEIMRLNGYKRIYDCGNNKYIFNN
jgi:rubredoxin